MLITCSATSSIAEMYMTISTSWYMFFCLSQ